MIKEWKLIFYLPDGTSLGTVSGGIADNVYLQNNKTIACSTFTSGASIGVTTQTSLTSGTPITFTDTNGVGQAAHFHSDSPGLSLV